MKKIFKKADYFLSKETGTFFKKPGGKIRVCLVYPNVYSVGITNLGFQTVYRLLNQRKDTICERAFLPDEISENTTIFSVESKTPLQEFDILAFSLCFENDYPNILKILKYSKIPYLTSQRQPHHPLLVAGGILCFSNPEPVSKIFDIVVVGEAEEIVDNFIEKFLTVRTNSDKKDFKRELKKELVKIDGFYIPEAYEEIYENGVLIGRKTLLDEAPERIKKVYSKNFYENFSYSSIISPLAAFPNMYLIETMRGCPFRCRFCLVGHVYTPVRKAKFEGIKDKIKTAKALKASVGLVAPTITAYQDLLKLIAEEEIEISFTSLRADKKTLDILKNLKNQKTVTLAPETGSERLRRAIKKGITEEEILTIVKELSETAVQTLKLYFMIGLPFEKDEDIDEIVRLIKKIRELFPRAISVSISVFVPKPFTPMQWHRMEDIEVVKDRLKKIKRDTTTIKGLRINHEVIKYSYLQGYFAQADRRALSVIERVSEGESFLKIFEEIKGFVYKVKDYKDFLPWDFIEHSGLTKEYLWSEYEKAKKEAFQIDNI
ncbi:MAG: radical SAM protein [Thermodesulfovibrio sp.]|nr:radical SAM protein [Thermodesulfovibrio sp.]